MKLLKSINCAMGRFPMLTCCVFFKLDYLFSNKNTKVLFILTGVLRGGLLGLRPLWINKNGFQWEFQAPSDTKPPPDKFLIAPRNIHTFYFQEDDLLDISHCRPPTSPSSNPNIVSVIIQNIKTNVTETPSGEISKYDTASVLKQSMSPPCSPLQQLSIDSSNGTERYKGK